MASVCGKLNLEEKNITINMQAIYNAEKRNNSYCKHLRNENAIMLFKDGAGTDVAVCK